MTPVDNRDVTLTLEHPVYSTNVRTIWFWVENHGTQEVTYGEPYTLEVWRDDAWHTIPFWNAETFTLISYRLEPGESRATSIRLGAFDHVFEEGRYRVVKDIGGDRVGEFTLGPSDISLTTPAGFGSLESLKPDYDRIAAHQDGVLVLSLDGRVSDSALVTQWLKKAAAGMPAMLRMMYFTVEGDPTVLDLHYDLYGNGEWTCRIDDSRDHWGNRAGITETLYGYLVTDGEALYLSDCASYDLLDQYPDARTREILPAGSCSAAQLQLVQDQTQRRLDGNTTRCTVYSPGAAWNASLAEGLEFAFGSAGSGEVQTLQVPDGVRLDGLWWLSGAQFLLRAETAGQSDYYAVFDVSEQSVLSETLASAVSFAADGSPVFENAAPVAG